MKKDKLNKLAQYIFEENIPKNKVTTYKDNYIYSFIDQNENPILKSLAFGSTLVFYYDSPNQSLIKNSLPKEDLITLHAELAKMYFDYFNIKDHNSNKNYNLLESVEEPDIVWLREKN